MIDWRVVEHQFVAATAAAAPGQLLSLSLPLAQAPPSMAWPGDDDFYWQRPNQGLRYQGSGQAWGMVSAGKARFATLNVAWRKLLADWQHHDPTAVAPAPLACLGFAFATDGGAPLPNARLWVPELLLCEQQGRHWLTMSCSAEHAASALDRWHARWVNLTAAQNQPHHATTLTATTDAAANQAFMQRAQAALLSINSRTLDKLVLTRAVHLKADSALVIPDVLAALAKLHPNCAVFGVTHQGTSFIGASPETLLTLNQQRVEVDALAGTAWGSTRAALGSHKNQHEHDLVAHAVCMALGRLCSHIELPTAATVLELNGLSHLHRRIVAQRPPDVSLFDLIDHLHPTPAVGGSPMAAAIDWLNHHGDQRAAWYTGGIGWADLNQQADVAVALRCGLIEGNTITLQAGAGLVTGSDPAKEFEETEAKLGAMRQALTIALGTTLGRTQDAPHEH